MPRYGWVTDPHLDAVDEAQRLAFFQRLTTSDLDGLWITGDIAESDSVLPILESLETVFQKTIFFVLGNHDYYGSSIKTMRGIVTQWVRGRERVKWLPMAGCTPLSETTALVGHGGWADGVIGDFLHSNIVLNDYRRISELVISDRRELLRRLRVYGQEAAADLERPLRSAVERFRKVVCLTHVPPFLESCWYQGEATLSEWTPHFTCGAVGQMLHRVALESPNTMIEVYCGHTHNSGVAVMAPNLTVHTGGAEYGAPELQRVIEVD